MKRPVRTIATSLLLALMLALSCGCTSEDLGSTNTQGDEERSESSEIERPNLVNPSQLPDSSFIYDASISSLEKADSYLDGQTVQITGEVVGDRVVSEEDPEMCWITLQATDKSFAEVSIYMTMRSSEMIDTYGAYGHEGTNLQVRGTFNLACKDHTGLSDLHATNVTVLNKGMVNKPGFSLGQAVPGMLLIVIAIGLIFGYKKLREKEL